MIKIHKDTIIYVLCPARGLTGGPEAIHQLVDKLRLFGHNAKIVPVPAVGNPTLLEYKNYDVEYTNAVADNEKNLLITPEIWPRKLDEYRSIQKAIWWLSVDNHEKQKEKFDFNKPENRNVVHFAQSTYAYKFLKQKRVENIYYLSDYLNAAFLRSYRPSNKRDIILYTPLKGAAWGIEQLRKIDRSLQWVPLYGYEQKMLIKKMRESKIYIDFGAHPGKDRLPREAAVSGCCAITSLTGSARFEEDLPIPQEYKFSLEQFDGEKIMNKICDCITNYNVRIHEFDQYVDIIRWQEKQFEYEIKNIFGVKALKEKPRIFIVLKNCWRFIKESAISKVSQVYIIKKLCKEFLPVSMLIALEKFLRYYRERTESLIYSFQKKFFGGKRKPRY